MGFIDSKPASFPTDPPFRGAIKAMKSVFVRAYGEEWSQGTLWTKLTRYAPSCTTPSRPLSPLS